MSLLQDAFFKKDSSRISADTEIEQCKLISFEVSS